MLTSTDYARPENQVFEYTDTLSLPIDPAKNVGAAIGSVVSVGSIFGIMLTNVAPTAAQIAEKAAADACYMPCKHTLSGNNRPGYATVRVRGGAWKIKGVAYSGAKAVGDAVYAHQDGDHVTVNFTASGGTRIGFLYQAIPAGGSTADAIVVLD